MTTLSSDFRERKCEKIFQRTPDVLTNAHARAMRNNNNNNNNNTIYIYIYIYYLPCAIKSLAVAMFLFTISTLALGNGANPLFAKWPNN